MGVTTQFARFLIEARDYRVSFKRTLTLGRQTLYADRNHLASLLHEHKRWPEGMTFEQFERRIAASPYVEPFLEMIGASEVFSLDVSGFEGANILHDLDKPVPRELHESFDCIIDGGLLEHVFNFPAAIESCMQMTKRGGHLIINTPASNFCGHGFYQFSPELFYRILSPENGFEVVRLLAQENPHTLGTFLGLPFSADHAGPRFETTDPAKLGQRVQFLTELPAVLLVLAKRTEIVPLFQSTPKQSDYVAAWRESGTQSSEKPAVYVPPLWRRVAAAMITAVTTQSYRERLRAYAFDRLRKPIVWRKYRQQSQYLRNGKLFRKID
jgi:SAM-dependent methyltransferase